MSAKVSDQDDISIETACSLAGATTETGRRLSAFLDLLRTWSTTTNLIGPRELAHPVRRHIYDSLQLLEYMDTGPVRLADIGSGAGFPGLVLACALADQPGAHVCLIEARRKRAEFLREAVAATGVAACVVHKRAENVSHETFDYVTARAVADLPRLFTYAKGLMNTTSVGMFHRGREDKAAIEYARRDWCFDMAQYRSRTDSEGRILIVTGLERRDR